MLFVGECWMFVEGCLFVVCRVWCLLLLVLIVRVLTCVVVGCRL